MKILTLNTHDITGGAARAAFRLHEALLQNNISSQMLVADKKSDIHSIITRSNGNMREKIWNKSGKITRIVLNKLLFAKYRKTISKNLGPFSPQAVSNRKLLEIINEINPDIVHLHWICGGFLSIEDIAKINAPIVWSLHDMWAFTGGCHLAAEQHPRPCGESGTMCDKYTGNCGSCDFLGSKKSRDLSFKVLRRKKKTFAKIKSMTIIGLSEWMADCAQKSAVFSDRKIVCLPNPINTNVFKPVDKSQSRILWNLPGDKKLILFGAVNAASIHYKGYDLLVEALNKISSENVEFVVFGSNEPENPPRLPLKFRYLGHLSDDAGLVSLYSACDVMVVPSRRENLSNVIMESLSCGTAVVCFDIGGNSDMVNHKINGYLARPFDTGDLARGIDWVLGNDGYDKLSENARAKAVREFDYGAVAEKYIDVYGKALL